MNENAKKWVAALRSGEYEQGRLTLLDLGGNYCCLGVACDVFMRATARGRWEGGTFEVDRDSSSEVLPHPVREWLGLADEMGAYSDENSSLIGDNDDRGISFQDIADTIEREPEGLFATAEEAS